VRYNHFHDQLVLSAGSDSHVVLSSVVSLSSDPYGQLAAGGDVDPDHDDDVVYAPLLCLTPIPPPCHVKGYLLAMTCGKCQLAPGDCTYRRASLTSREPRSTEKKEPQADEVVRKYSEHEDSVYAVEWRCGLGAEFGRVLLFFWMARSS
jgi:hypothetical protein